MSESLPSFHEYASVIGAEVGAMSDAGVKELIEIELADGSAYIVIACGKEEAELLKQATVRMNLMPGIIDYRKRQAAAKQADAVAATHPERN